MNSIKPTEPISPALFAKAEKGKHNRDTILQMSGFITNIFLIKEDIHYGGGALIEGVRNNSRGLYVVKYTVNRFDELRSIESNIDFSGNLVDVSSPGRPVFFSDNGITGIDEDLMALTDVPKLIAT